MHPLPWSARSRCWATVNHPGRRPRAGGRCSKGSARTWSSRRFDGPRFALRGYGGTGHLPRAVSYPPRRFEMASALHYLRRAGALSHLDVEPSNIIMGAPARLIDLCLWARPVGDAEALCANSARHSILYMSPEQWRPGPRSARPAPHRTCPPSARRSSAPLHRRAAVRRRGAWVGQRPQRLPQLVDPSAHGLCPGRGAGRRGRRSCSPMAGARAGGTGRCPHEWREGAAAGARADPPGTAGLARDRASQSSGRSKW